MGARPGGRLKTLVNTTPQIAKLRRGRASVVGHFPPTNCGHVASPATTSPTEGSTPVHTQAPEIAAAILELFHLLPPQAAKFLETKGAPLPFNQASVLSWAPRHLAQQPRSPF